MCKEAFSKRLVQLRMAKGVSARDMIAQCCSSGKRLLFSYFLNSLLAWKRFIYHLILYHIITNLPTLRPPKAHLLHISVSESQQKKLNPYTG